MDLEDRVKNLENKTGRLPGALTDRLATAEASTSSNVAALSNRLDTLERKTGRLPGAIGDRLDVLERGGG